MSVVTYEGAIEHAQVQLKTQARLPEGARLYVIVPAASTEPAARIVRPGLVHPEQICDVIAGTTSLCLGTGQATWEALVPQQRGPRCHPSTLVVDQEFLPHAIVI